MDEFSVDGPMSRHRAHGDVAARCWALARVWAVGLTLAIVCQSALAQAMYRIRPLGYLGGCTTYAATVAGLNKADQVTGQACNANGDLHAFLWNNDGNPMVDLGPPEVGSTSESVAINASGLIGGDAQDSSGEYGFESSGAGTPMKKIPDGLGGSTIYPNGINDLGQLSGSAYLTGDTVEHAFVWKKDGSPMLDLGTLGGASSNSIGIGASGQAAGSSDLPGNAAHHAFVWKNDGSPMLDLGTLGGASSNALFINASGQVAGISETPHATVQHAFFWRNDGTSMQDLGTLGGPYVQPYALSDAGQVAGYSYTHNPGAVNAHAFVWMNDGTPMKDLGATLGGHRSIAYGINSAGQVTGFADLAGDRSWHAFLWRNDGTKMQDLNKLIDPTDPLKPYVTLYIGEIINDLGDVVADGTDSRSRVSGLYLLQGTVITLTPRALAFGSQPIKTTSAAKSVTVTNTSAKVVLISSIALTGTAAGQFAQTNKCGKSLAAHATCTIKVTFKPTTKGAKSATLNVNGGGGGLRVVTLTGTGT